MKNHRITIALVCAAVFVLAAFLLLLIPFSDETGENEAGEESAAESTASVTSVPPETECRDLLAGVLSEYKRTGRDTATLQETIPFAWDELKMENGSYTFYYNGSRVYSYRKETEREFELVFNYQEHETEFLKKEEKTSCHLTVRQGRPRLRIHNEAYGRAHGGQEGVWNVESKEKEDAAKTAEAQSYAPDSVYTYDVTAGDARVTDPNNPQIRYFTEDNNKTGDVTGVSDFSYDEKGRPVVYTGGENPSVSVWNEKKNFWKTEKSEMIERVQESLGVHIRDIKHWREKGRYTASYEEGWVIFDADGKVHNKVYLEDLEYNSYYNGRKCASQEDAFWIRGDVYGFVVNNHDVVEEDDPEKFYSNHSLVLYNLPGEEKLFEIQLEGYQYLVQGIYLYEAGWDAEDFIIKRTDLIDRTEEKVSCKNLKLAPTGFQAGIPQEKWLLQQELFRFDVYQNQIYLLTKAGLYQLNMSNRVWQLIMDGTRMPGLSGEGRALRRFLMCDRGEFYAYAERSSNIDSGEFYTYTGDTASDSPGLYHYKEVEEEPLTMATDDLCIENGAVTEFCGRLDDGGKIDIPKGVMRIAGGAFAQKQSVPGLQNRRRLVLFYEYSRDPDAFRNCVPIQVEMSRFKKTVHANYFSDIENEGVQVILSRKLRKMDVEGMNGTVEWRFQGIYPPVVINREKGAPDFLRMVVPEGSKEWYIQAFDLPETLRDRVVERY